MTDRTVFRLRDAREHDLDRILDITNHAIAHTTAIWSLAPTTLEERRAWFRGRRERGYPVLVAEDGDGRVLGFASYGEFRPREDRRERQDGRGERGGAPVEAG